MEQEIHVKDGVLYVLQPDTKAAIRIEAITQVIIHGSQTVHIEGINVGLTLETNNVKHQQLLLSLLTYEVDLERERLDRKVKALADIAFDRLDDYRDTHN